MMQMDCPMATLSPSFTKMGSPGAGLRYTVPLMGATISTPPLTAASAAAAAGGAAAGAADGAGAGAAGAAAGAAAAGSAADGGRQ